MQTSDARIDTGYSLLKGSSGRWAGEQFMRALAEGRDMSVADLRTLATLRHEEWLVYDNALIEEAQIRLRGVADLISAGLVITIPNGLGKTEYRYEKMTDMEEAIVSMDGVVRSENDRVEFSESGLPLPITHKDFNINLRTLRASRNGGMPLDTTSARIAGRKCAEKTEEMLFNGGKTFGGLAIYGYTTHPNRNVTSFGTGGAWSGSKTGEQILADVLSLIAIAEADRYYGPFVLYVPSTTGIHLGNDFKANSDKTIWQRLMELQQIADIRVSEQLTSEVVLVQMSRDVVAMVIGEGLQTVQWDINGGFEVAFKAFQIMVPLLRTDSDGRSGIVHMS